MGCHCRDPPVRARIGSRVDESTLIADLFENRLAHEFRNGSALRRRQMPVENFSLRQHRIEVLDEPSVFAADAAKVFVPRFQTEWK